MSASPIKADMRTLASLCPLCARNGREQSQQGSPYSIISSARASSVGVSSGPLLTPPHA